MRSLAVVFAASFAVALPFVQVRPAPEPAPAVEAPHAPPAIAPRPCPGDQGGPAGPSPWTAGMPPGPGAVAVARSLEPEWASLERRLSAGAPEEAARARAGLQAWHHRLDARGALACAGAPDDDATTAARR